jgi:hypothetical protein
MWKRATGHRGVKIARRLQRAAYHDDADHRPIALNQGLLGSERYRGSSCHIRLPEFSSNRLYTIYIYAGDGRFQQLLDLGSD